MPTEITIATKDGPKTIPVTFVAGHFATHPTESYNPESPLAGRWTVTHVPTGLAISQYCKDADAAQELAEWIKAQFEEHGVDASFTDPVKMRAEARGGLADAAEARRKEVYLEYLDSQPEAAA